MCHGSGSQGGCVPLRIGSENVGLLRGRDGSEYGYGRMSRLLLSPGDKRERRGC